MTLPKVHFIEARVGESIISIAARAKNPTLEPLTSLLYTVTFDGSPDFPGVIRTISDAFKPFALGVEFLIPGGGSFLTIDPDYGHRDLYQGLKILQRLLKPRIPRTALVYESTGPADRWNIQLSILGGYLSRDQVAFITAKVEAAGAVVAQVRRSEKQQADVFFITVPARSNRSRRGFLRSLQSSCGVFAAVQAPL